MFGMPIDWIKLYQAFDVGPLQANQFEDLYVELADVRGENEPGSVASYLEGSIRSSSTYTCQIVSGHEGSGKSTELRRVQKNLETGPKRVFCVVADIEGDVPLDDADFPDLLLAIVRQTAVALRDRLKIDLQPGYFADRARKIKELLLTEVDLKEARLDTALGVMVASLRQAPESREKIRQALNPRVQSLLEAANEVFSEARTRLKSHGFDDLAIIVDGTDKLKRGYGADTERYPGERLFVHRADQTRGFECHIIYAVPLALVHSPLVSDLEQLYGQQTPIIPVTKLHDRAGKRLDLSYARFLEILRKRVAFAGESFDAVFPNPGATDDLIRFSGGQPRVLCALARDCLRPQAPIHKSVVEAVARKETMALRKALELPHWQVLAEFLAGKQPLPAPETREVFRDLLIVRALLYYRNSQEWLGVNPLVGNLPEGVNRIHV